jgi:hypothetical protein
MHTVFIVDAEWGPEDPMLYLDANHIFHAVFHSQLVRDDERLCGGHAWSDEGLRWTFTGTAWSNTVQFSSAGDSDSSGLESQGESYNYSYTFSRRERPHLSFADPSDPFKITALTTGVQYGGHAPISAAGEDACYTLLQPVRA